MKMGNTTAAILLTAVLLAGWATIAPAQPVETNVPAGLKLSTDLGRVDPGTEINITVHLTLNDKAAFDKAVDALYDPASPTYHQWMSDADLMKYGPTAAQRQLVISELQSRGLTILSTDPIGFTIRARGTIENVESAFNTEIHQFNYNGRTYRANVRDAQMSGVAGNYVSTVAGLESHQARPLSMRALMPGTQQPFPSVVLNKKSLISGFPPVSTTECLSTPIGVGATNGGTSMYYWGTLYSNDSYGNSNYCDYLPSQLQAVYGLNAVYGAGYNGKGQTIVLVEAYGYPTLKSDANAFFE